jgi:hypothetical protein
MKNIVKGQGKGKGKAFTYHKCGGPNCFARKCRTPKYLVELYQKCYNFVDNAFKPRNAQVDGQ